MPIHLRRGGPGANEGNDILIWGGDVSWTDLPSDANLYTISTGLQYVHWMELDGIGYPNPIIYVDLGVGWNEFDSPIMDREGAPSAYAGIGLGYDLSTVGNVSSVVLQVRYRTLEFDTQYGDLDASGFEIVISWRGHWWNM